MGVGQDDFVTLALPNGLEFYETAFAIWKLGATVNPVSWRLPDAELRAIVETAEPKLVVGVDPARLPDRMVIPPGFEPDPGLSDAPLPAQGREILARDDQRRQHGTAQGDRRPYGGALGTRR